MHEGRGKSMNYKVVELDGRFTVFELLKTIIGPQKLITGETVNLQTGISAWGHVAGCPSFKTKAEANECMLGLRKFNL